MMANAMTKTMIMAIQREWLSHLCSVSKSQLNMCAMRNLENAEEVERASDVLQMRGPSMLCAMETSDSPGPLIPRVSNVLIGIGIAGGSGTRARSSAGFGRGSVCRFDRLIGVGTVAVIPLLDLLTGAGIAVLGTYGVRGSLELDEEGGLAEAGLLYLRSSRRHAESLSLLQLGTLLSTWRELATAGLKELGGRDGGAEDGGEGEEGGGG